MDTGNESIDIHWNALYRVAGVTALAVVLTGIAELAITFLPGGRTPAETVVDWFNLLQSHPFIGLRNLGLLNIVMTLLGLPMTLALYAAHRRANRPFAALALIIAILGAAVFYGTNRAFPMLDLSRQYAAAATEAQRAALVAAGQAMLSVGQSHTPGTYLAFLLSEIGGLTMSAVILQGRVFSRATGIVGILGWACFLVFDFSASFLTGLSDLALVLAVSGGLLVWAWHILIALRLFKLAQGSGEERR